MINPRTMNDNWTFWSTIGGATKANKKWFDFYVGLWNESGSYEVLTVKQSSCLISLPNDPRFEVHFTFGSFFNPRSTLLDEVRFQLAFHITAFYELWHEFRFTSVFIAVRCDWDDYRMPWAYQLGHFRGFLYEGTALTVVKWYLSKIENSGIIFFRFRQVSFNTFQYWNCQSLPF